MSAKVMENSLVSVMNGGDGPNSYTHNSKAQRETIDRSITMLSNSIQQKLKISEDDCKKVFTIADLGCAAGPNTFICVNTMIEAVKNTFKTTLSLQAPEFHVFFNDHVDNDFNTLFKALLPSDMPYFAAGVPGSFHGRLFPKASMNLIYSANSLHWLTQVPQQVMKRDSPAWNKGRVTYVQSSSQVVEAYTAQFLNDLKSFFGARSKEMVKDGLLVMYMLSRPDGSPPSESKFMQKLDFCFGQSLADMAEEGIVSQALLDSFNLPIYMPNVSEFKQVLSGIKNLSIEQTGEICIREKLSTLDDARENSNNTRALIEGILSEHFGPELVMDELFERNAQKLHKLSKMPRFSRIGDLEMQFVLVKCNAI